MKVRFVKEMAGPGGITHPIGREVDHPQMYIHLIQGNAEPVDDEAVAWWDGYKVVLERRRLDEARKAAKNTAKAIEGTKTKLFGRAKHATESSGHPEQPGSETEDGQRGGMEGGSDRQGDDA